MQVPSTITINNGNRKNHDNDFFMENDGPYQMDIPEKLTGSLNLFHFFIVFVFIFNNFK
jgi:hypothetical protein